MAAQKKVILVFVKNILLGKVKTRLAKTKGDVFAFHVYKKLVDYTQAVTEKMTDCDLQIYFSDVVIQNKWEKHQKLVQHGTDLGERMLNAFQSAFENTYESVLIIGSDCPEINTTILNDAFDKLQSHDAVIGPAADNGYYLLGMKKLHAPLFQNINWSTAEVFPQTKKIAKDLNLSIALLPVLSDIDTEEDLKKFPEFYP